MIAAYVPYASFKFYACVVACSGAAVDEYSTTPNGIVTSPLGVAINPAEVSLSQDFYVWQTSGSLLGFNCAQGTCLNEPVQPIDNVPGEVPKIKAPRGVVGFTAAVFSQY
jgi:hypothetical protein